MFTFEARLKFVFVIATTLVCGVVARMSERPGGSVALAVEKAPDKSATESAPATDNLLRNAGFDEGEGTKEPSDWTRGFAVPGVEYSWDKKQGKEAKGCLCLNKTAKRFFPIAQWYQIIEKKPGSKMLKVSAQVKAMRASKATIDVIFLDEKSEMLSHEWSAYIGAKEANDPPATHDWKEYAGSVKIPDEAKKIQIGLQIYGPGRVWFDDIRASYED